LRGSWKEFPVIQIIAFKRLKEDEESGGMPWLHVAGAGAGRGKQDMLRSAKNINIQVLNGILCLLPLN
jgi:hypothetical protein